MSWFQLLIFCVQMASLHSQIEHNQKIASLHIHVERHINRVKKYKLFQGVIPLTMAGSINQLWVGCCKTVQKIINKKNSK